MCVLNHDAAMSPACASSGAFLDQLARAGNDRQAALAAQVLVGLLVQFHGLLVGPAHDQQVEALMAASTAGPASSTRPPSDTTATTSLPSRAAAISAAELPWPAPT